MSSISIDITHSVIELIIDDIICFKKDCRHMVNVFHIIKSKISFSSFHLEDLESQKIFASYIHSNQYNENTYLLFVIFNPSDYFLNNYTSIILNNQAFIKKSSPIISMINYSLGEKNYEIITSQIEYYLVNLYFYLLNYKVTTVTPHESHKPIDIPHPNTDERTEFFNGGSKVYISDSIGNFLIDYEMSNIDETIESIASINSFKDPFTYEGVIINELDTKSEKKLDTEDSLNTSEFIDEIDELQSLNRSNIDEFSKMINDEDVTNINKEQVENIILLKNSIDKQISEENKCMETIVSDITLIDDNIKEEVNKSRALDEMLDSDIYKLEFDNYNNDTSTLCPNLKGENQYEENTVIAFKKIYNKMEADKLKLLKFLSDIHPSPKKYDYNSFIQIQIANNLFLPANKILNRYYEISNKNFLFITTKFIKSLTSIHIKHQLFKKRWSSIKVNFDINSINITDSIYDECKTIIINRKDEILNACCNISTKMLINTHFIYTIPSIDKIFMINNLLNTKENFYSIVNKKLCDEKDKLECHEKDLRKFVKRIVLDVVKTHTLIILDVHPLTSCTNSLLLQKNNIHVIEKKIEIVKNRNIEEEKNKLLTLNKEKTKHIEKLLSMNKNIYDIKEKNNVRLKNLIETFKVEKQTRENILSKKKEEKLNAIHAAKLAITKKIEELRAKQRDALEIKKKEEINKCDKLSKLINKRVEERLNLISKEINKFNEIQKEQKELINKRQKQMLNLNKLRTKYIQSVIDSEQERQRKKREEHRVKFKKDLIKYEENKARVEKEKQMYKLKIQKYFENRDKQRALQISEYREKIIAEKKRSLNDNTLNVFHTRGRNLAIINTYHTKHYDKLNNNNNNNEILEKRKKLDEGVKKNEKRKGELNKFLKEIFISYYRNQQQKLDDNYRTISHMNYKTHEQYTKKLELENKGIANAKKKITNIIKKYDTNKTSYLNDKYSKLNGNNEILNLNKLYERVTSDINFILISHKPTEEIPNSNNSFKNEINKLNNVYKNTLKTFNILEETQHKINQTQIESDFDKQIEIVASFIKIKEACIEYADQYEILLENIKENNSIKLRYLEELREVERQNQIKLNYRIDKYNKFKMKYKNLLKLGLKEIAEKKMKYNYVIKEIIINTDAKKRKLIIKKLNTKNKINSDHLARRLEQVRQKSDNQKYKTIVIW